MVDATRPVRDLGVGEDDFSSEGPQLSDINENSKSRLVFRVDATRIESVPCYEQSSELQNLGLQVYNQEAFEQGVLAQVDEEIAAEEKRQAVRMLQKELTDINTDIRLCEEELCNIQKVLIMIEGEKLPSREVMHRLHSVRKQKENKMRQLKTLNARKHSTTQRLDTVTRTPAVNPVENSPGTRGVGHLLGFNDPSCHEAGSDRMIRLGEMTPFGTVMSANKTAVVPTSDFESYLLNQGKLSQRKKIAKLYKKKSTFPCTGEPRSKNLKTNAKLRGSNSHGKLIGTKKRKIAKTTLSSASRSCGLAENQDDDGGDDDDDDDDDDNSDCWIPDDEEDYEESDYESETKPKRTRKEDWSGFGEPSGNARKRLRKNGAVMDDGDEKMYRQRLKDYDDNMQKFQTVDEDDSGSDAEFDGGFCVPGRIWNKLYRYQKTGVRWLWELHCQQAGGILGDEMGLGKTIQLICFLAGLRHSKLRDQGSMSKYSGLGPTLIVCPATVMHQWVKELHIWWPIARAAILHSSGTANIPEASLVHQIVKSCGVLVTGYSTVVNKQDVLLKYDWHYVILDEGHKIRNPDAQMTLACKQFRTCHRLILSGSPIQNNLKELWSLFDFVFPGKLGTLPDFMQQFSVPIVQGGYANASNIQVQTAYKCACVLRDTIAPYLLRRLKSDVKTTLQLPNKNEQVLFCRLSQHQRDVYKEYLDSKECRQILAGKFMVFPGLITLRKICNHPDLSTGGPKIFGDVAELSDQSEEMEFGFWRRSGKMVVIEALLSLWKKQNHKVLLFTQSRQMLDILEKFVQQRRYSYLRMDGATTISARQPMVQQFNMDSTIFVFLLTTRVGGLGINLTGADRVVIYDPDWNPSTDTQARERAWRIGQTRQVTIYRLLTTGTIEEKIYHRQIFKQFLTNRILKDPKQRRFFKSNDLYELFTLGDDDPAAGTETSAIFAGTNSDIKAAEAHKKSSKKQKKHKKNLFDALKDKEKEFGLDPKDPEDEEQDEEDDRRAALMWELAKQVSLRISLGQRDPKVGDKSEKNSEKPCSVAEEIEPESNAATVPLLAKSNSNGDADKTKGKTCSKSVIKALRDLRKSKKLKRRKRTLVDGEKISNVDRSAAYRHENDEESKTSEATGQDDYILRKLLKKSGSVHSAMQHDHIMMSSNPDFVLVENEADQVARRAVQALKLSRARCRQASTLGMPTWTGQNGVAGAPTQSARPRFGQKRNPAFQIDVAKSNKALTAATTTSEMTSCSVDSGVGFDGAALLRSNPEIHPKPLLSSSELLTRIMARSELPEPPVSNDLDETPEPSSANQSLPHSTPSGDELQLLTEIRNFIACEAATDGQATTTELLEKFKSSLPHSKSAVFKAMLKQISEFYRENGSGIWRLKPEFR